MSISILINKRKALIIIVDHCLLAFCFIEPNSTSLFYFFIACLTFDTETVSLHISHEKIIITILNSSIPSLSDKTRQGKTGQDKTLFNYQNKKVNLLICFPVPCANSV